MVNSKPIATFKVSDQTIQYANDLFRNELNKKTISYRPNPYGTLIHKYSMCYRNNIIVVNFSNKQPKITNTV